MKNAQRSLAFLEQHGLGDLKLQAAGRKPGGGQCGDDGLHEAGACKLRGGDVHRHSRGARPGGGVGAGLPQRPFPQRNDESCFFGDSDELQRGRYAAHGTFPAQKRFETRDLVVREVDDRLIVQFEFALGQGLAEIDLKRPAGLGLRIHGRLEETMRAAALVLRLVESEIGVLQKAVRLGPVAGSHRDADAHADDHGLAVELDRPADRIDQPPGESG